VRESLPSCFAAPDFESESRFVADWIDLVFTGRRRLKRIFHSIPSQSSILRSAKEAVDFDPPRLSFRRDQSVALNSVPAILEAGGGLLHKLASDSRCSNLGKKLLVLGFRTERRR
jgi:hypothetical protein